jgi:hypothetical protein
VTVVPPKASVPAPALVEVEVRELKAPPLTTKSPLKTRSLTPLKVMLLVSGVPVPLTPRSVPAVPSAVRDQTRVRPGTGGAVS